MDNPIKMDDLGVSLFLETSILGGPKESLSFHYPLFGKRPKNPGGERWTEQLWLGKLQETTSGFAAATVVWTCPDKKNKGSQPLESFLV